MFAVLSQVGGVGFLDEHERSVDDEVTHRTDVADELADELRRVGDVFEDVEADECVEVFMRD